MPEEVIEYIVAEVERRNNCHFSDLVPRVESVKELFVCFGI
jgi:hypothetical protein